MSLTGSGLKRISSETAKTEMPAGRSADELVFFQNEFRADSRPIAMTKAL